MFMKPMQMTTCKEPFDDERYIYEPIINGHRLLLSFINNKAQLYTKHNNEVTRQYPELLKVPIKLPSDVLFDGEVACVNPTTGEVEFDTLIERYRMKKESRIREGAASMPVRFFVFDILYYNGIDMRERPLMERKRLLNDIIDNNKHFQVMPFIEEAGYSLYKLIKQLKLEGVACKRKDSVYTEGRSDYWLRIANDEFTDLHISSRNKAMPSKPIISAASLRTAEGC